MQTDVHVEGQRKGQEGEEQAGRVEDTGLKVTEEGGAAEIIRAPVGDGVVLEGLSKKIFCRIKPPVNVTKKESLSRKKDRMEKKKNQPDRQTERHALFQNAQFHIQKDIYFDIIIITKVPGFSPGKTAPK